MPAIDHFDLEFLLQRQIKQRLAFLHEILSDFGRDGRVHKVEEPHIDQRVAEIGEELGFRVSGGGLGVIENGNSCKCTGLGVGGHTGWVFIAGILITNGGKQRVKYED